MSAVAVHVAEPIATITLNRPDSYNALTPQGEPNACTSAPHHDSSGTFSQDYEDFAEALRTIDKRQDVLVTVWQATGKFFCA